MAKRPVDLTGMPGYDPSLKNYRRRCSICGGWALVHYKSKYAKCPDCQDEPIPNAKQGVALDVIKKTYYRVVECPDPYGYRRGAAFAAGEITEMKRISQLIPGMILERCGKRYICKSNRLEEL